MTTKLPIICWTKARNGHGELEAKEDLLGAVDIIELQLQTQKPRKWIRVFFRELKLLSISEFRILSERENNCYRDSTKEVQLQVNETFQVAGRIKYFFSEWEKLTSDMITFGNGQRLPHNIQKC